MTDAINTTATEVAAAAAIVTRKAAYYQISLAEADDVRRVEHAPHGWTYIHPVQDPQGKALEVANGFRSRSSVITEKGDDPVEVDEERLADQRREEDLGINPPPAAGSEPAPAPAPSGPQKGKPP